jgi:cell division protease FtsH
LHKISIIPRGRAGGYTLLLPKEDRRYVTKSQMLDELVIYLGGRMAEELVLKDISTGAQNDLERATEIVRQMITRYGMSEDLGPLTFGKRTDTVFLGRDISQERNYSEAIAYAIDKEARQMIDEAYTRGKNILSENIDKLHAVAAALMEKETLQAEEFYQLMKGDKDAEDLTADDSDNGALPIPDSNVQAAPWPAAPQPEKTRPEDMSIQETSGQKKEDQSPEINVLYSPKDED